MKIRNGFVSNSSSSSFIVVFDEDPRNNPSYLKRVLYNNRDYIVPEYSSDDFNRVSTDILVKEILRELSDKEQVTHKDLIDLLKDDMIPYYEDHRYKAGIDYNSEEYAELCEKHDKKSFQLALKYAKKYIEYSTQGKFVFILAFADEDGRIGSQLEHGGTFDALPHHCISHH